MSWKNPSVEQWIMEALPKLYPKAKGNEIKSLCTYALRFMPDWMLPHSNRTVAITLIWISGGVLANFEEYPFVVRLTQKHICDTLGGISPTTIRLCGGALQPPSDTHI